MASPLEQSRQVYLIIAGQQSGPFDEKTILDKLKTLEIPHDALIWYEGLSEWITIKDADWIQANILSQPPLVSSLANILGTQSESSSLAPHTLPFKSDEVTRTEIRVPIQTVTIKRPKTASALKTYASSPENLEPVFPASKPKLAQRWLHWKKPGLVIGASLVSLTILGMATRVGFRYFTKKQNAGSAPIEVNSNLSAREMDLRLTLSELLVQPQKSVEKLTKICLDNPNDSIGKEAQNAVVEYFRSRQLYQKAGSFLISIRQPEAAYPFFLMEPPFYSDAEQALAAALQKTDQKKELWLKQIEILVGPLRNLEKGIQTIRQFETKFPGVSHPYRYYVRSVSEKISDLFRRTSLHFTKSLNEHLRAELPQMQLLGTPSVEIRRDRLNRYRIVASYKGLVTLNEDRLNDIFFTLWFFRGSWSMVGTNLSRERQAYALTEQQKRDKEAFKEDELLKYLESIFQSRFPRLGLHETIEIKSARTDDDE